MSYRDEIFQFVRFNELDQLRQKTGTFDINQLDEDGQTLLHEAVTHNATRIGEELIQMGINVNQADKHGQTALHCAALYKNAELAEIVLKAGGDPNLRDIHENNALWTAVFNAKGDYRLVKLYRAYGADPFHKNKYGRSPIDFANQIKDTALIALLE